MVFTREQETELKLESFYLFKSKLERRFEFNMSAGQRYSVALEAWATDPEILNRSPLYGKMYQGAALRLCEHIDIPRAIASAAESAEAADYAVVCVGTNK
jgi:beta-glucosidase